ncbi:MAG TPA: L,D-transpeptidase family protein [Beijerinckiaceae bacterium]|nr:L,D-transpeptidase family protein [Beijerinckiaceae bacterium]
MNRRLFLMGAVSAGAVSTSAAVAAPNDGGIIGGQAEWRQQYDSSPLRHRPVKSSAPILSPQTIAATEQAVGLLQQVVQRGGWQPLPTSIRLKLGVKHPNVVALRGRLITGGDLDGTNANSQIFDSYVEAGVKRFQERHGLGATGVVGPQTFAAFNVPSDVRLRQLEINLVRLKTFGQNLNGRYVMANIPAAYVETVENNIVATRHVAGVGKIDRQSPIMSARVLDINFNPFWTVPASIIKKDLIPRMQKDPNYLTEQKIRIYNKAGQELPPQQVNWNSNEATNYMFRQDPGGEFNSLGFVRINIANPHGVYMHDTPAKGIFGDDFRFVSSGCIRVQNVRDFVAWILKDTPGWDRDQIEAAIRSGQRQDARPPAPIPVYWVYVTAWATPEGAMQFRDDIYGRDGFGPGAVTAAIQAGDSEPE